MLTVFVEACYYKSIFHLDVLPILFLQQTLVIGFDAKCEVRAGNDVSPVTSQSHFVPYLSRQNQNLVAVILMTYGGLADMSLPD